ncbi:CRISPR-associated protein Csx16 [Pseudomonas sp. UBA6323]|uniref:CRISPR-associated protein Csx16 n=1 Tax=Pseudomonas sp. UBA6323 TaxID=1947329 RepID=UPI0025CB8D0B|nr:CRISPR-associated protein Csx16 [Pseudomonas sp. UBA6323]
MTRWFVSRHAGAHDWLAARGLSVDRQIAHLDPEQIALGDLVIGTLPINLVAALCARGARYVHLALELPAEARGRELSAAELDRFGARLTCYDVRELPCDFNA